MGINVVWIRYDCQCQRYLISGIAVFAKFGLLKLNLSLPYLSLVLCYYILLISIFKSCKLFKALVYGVIIIIYFVYTVEVTRYDW